MKNNRRLRCLLKRGKKLKILICDDEVRVAKGINEMLKMLIAESGIQATTIVLTSTDKIEKSDMSEYEIAFLDIDMGKQNGIEIARKLHLANPMAIVVFVTNYIEYAPAGYEVNAFRYLLKNEMTLSLPKIFSDVMEEYKKLHRVVSFKAGAENIDVPVNDVLYLESHQRIIEMHLISERRTTYEFYSTMAHMTEQLESLGFLRIQRSYLVNMNYIEAVQYGQIRLSDGTKLTVSEKNYSEVKRKFLLWRAKNKWNIV